MTRLLLPSRGRMRRVPSTFSRINAMQPLTTKQGACSQPTRQSPSPLSQLQRSRSTTASSILNLIMPTSVQETVKSSLLDKATRDDSEVWSATADDTSHRHHARHQQDSNKNKISNDSNANMNGSVINGGNERQWDGGGVNDPIMSSSLSPFATTTAAATTMPTTWHHHDPLDDLLLENETTKYWPSLPSGVQGLEVADPFKLAKADVDSLSQSIREDLIGTDHPVLNQAASYFFGTADGGKKVRPLMVMLLSRALADTVNAMEDRMMRSNSTDGEIINGSRAPSPTNIINGDHHHRNDNKTMFISPLQWQRHDLPQAQRRLAEISEMIHTASLFHDDVIDGSETRRGNPAVHMVFGNKTAILAGDYLLARASISLARLRHVEVVETMSTIIEHLVRGEVMQMRGNSNQRQKTDLDGPSENQSQERNDRMTYYLKKNYYKTGSLMANACKSAALLADCPQDLVLSSYQYGKHVGMAFQLVDDVLDFEGDVVSLGKPALADLRAGLSTAPVLFAAEEYPELEAMMDRKFKNDGDVERAREWVLQSSGMERTKNLARVHAERAMDSVMSWQGESIYRDALINLAYKVVERTK